MNKPNLLIRRSLAYLIDCTFIYIYFALSQLTIFSPLTRSLGDEWFYNGYNTEIYTLITISIPVWLYFTILDSKSKGSWGKRFLKIVVVRDSINAPPSITLSLARALCKLLPWEIAHLANNIPIPLYYDPNPSFRLGLIVSIVLLLIYLIVVAKTKGSKTVYDLLLKTSVVMRNVA